MQQVGKGARASDVYGYDLRVRGSISWLFCKACSPCDEWMSAEAVLPSGSCPAGLLCRRLTHEPCDQNDSAKVCKNPPTPYKKWKQCAFRGSTAQCARSRADLPIDAARMQLLRRETADTKFDMLAGVRPSPEKRSLPEPQCPVG